MKLNSIVLLLIFLGNCSPGKRQCLKTDKEKKELNVQGVRIVMNKNTELCYSIIEYRGFMNVGVDLHFNKGEAFISTIDNVVPSTIRANGFAFNLSEIAPI